MSDSLTILSGDVSAMLPLLPEQSVHCVVTSPPYWGLRDYGAPGQIGLEKTPVEYVAAVVAVFRQVWRVLRDDGVLFLNIGDSYANDGKWGGRTGGKHCKALHGSPVGRTKKLTGLKPKDLIGIPWRVAFALQSDGWYLRSDIIWSKPNPMPESVTDRPTRAHEYIFLLTKSQRYYYDAAAIREPAKESTIRQVLDGYNGQASKDFEANGFQDASATKKRVINGLRKRVDKQRGHSRRHAGFNDRWDSMTKEEQQLLGSNKRSVWTVATAIFREAHFATFPPDLIKPCILAGCPVGGTVLDPFGGSGTTGAVALELGRKAILCELNPDYVEMIKRRCNVTPGLALA